MAVQCDSARMFHHVINEHVHGNVSVHSQFTIKQHDAIKQYEAGVTPVAWPLLPVLDTRFEHSKSVPKCHLCSVYMYEWV